MLLKLTRKTFTDQSTMGELLVDGEFECFTLEDVVREEKIKHETAIPTGRYEVVISFSEKFQKMLPLLVNVPDFAGIRIHPGNTKKDTSGCILVGRTKAKDFVGNSRDAFNALFTKIKAAMKKEKIFIEIGEEH